MCSYQIFLQWRNVQSPDIFTIIDKKVFIFSCLLVIMGAFFWQLHHTTCNYQLILNIFLSAMMVSTQLNEKLSCNKNPKTL